MHRRSNDKQPNPNDLWELTDKKRPETYFLKREQANKPIGDMAKTAEENAQMAAYGTLPVITMTGIEIMASKGGGFIDFSPLGFPIAVGGILIDSVKAPFTLLFAAEEGLRCGILKLSSLLLERDPQQAEVNRILDSFVVRMHETAAILIALQLAEKDILIKKLKSGDIEDLVGLTLLHTAFASRNHWDLVLASNKYLSREDCPVFGRKLYDKIVDIRNMIKAAIANVSPNAYRLNTQERQLEESRIVCGWIKEIYAGKQLTATERPDASQAQLDVINKLITEIDAMKKLAMQTLPVEPQKIANRIKM